MFVIRGCITRDDFIVMVIIGPNSRKDFYVNESEEWFWQYKGDLELRCILDHKMETINVKQGEMLLLPISPHCPVRPDETIGLVVEKARQQSNVDELRWYCKHCTFLMYQVSFHCISLKVTLETF